MTEIVYILAGIDKALAFEWIADGLDKKKFSLSFIFLDSKLGKTQSYLERTGVRTNRIELGSKRDYPKAFIQLSRMLRELEPHVVHTHMRDADLIGLSAARLLGIKHRISTRHSSIYNHIHHPRSVYLDKLITKQSTKTIAISDVVKRTLIEKENAPPAKVKVIHHGFPLKYFREVSESRTRTVRQKHLIPSDKKVIGVIARHIEWKGIQHIIEAFVKLIEEGENVFLILANANGPFHDNLLASLGRIPKSTYTNISFEEDIPALYKCFDLYVHTPIDPDIEAFGQTYVEALASGIPSIFSLSGIAHEFIKHNHNAIVVPHQSSEAIHLAMTRLLKDEKLVKRLINQGLQDVRPFDLSYFISALEELYSS